MICDLVIPALDERANIDPLFDALECVRAARQPVDWFEIRHVILADNGSTDGTAEAASSRGAIVVHEPERGYGGACLAAIAWIADRNDPPDTLVFLDADLADDPETMPDLLAPLERGDAEIVIGSRVARAEAEALNLAQRVGNRLACALMAVLTRRRYTDLGPFRAIRWETLERLAMTDRTWGWTVEMQMKAALLGVRVVEIDVAYRRRRSGRSKVSGTLWSVVRVGTKIIATILGLWWRRARIRAASRPGR